LSGRKARIAVMGAGLIGQQHLKHVAAEAELCAIVDPDKAARTLGRRYGVPCFDTLGAMLAVRRPDGVIVATPNQLHGEHGLACVQAGMPVLVEKPITDTVQTATELVAAAEAANVALLVGHHRRHNPLIAAAHQAIKAGRIGTIVSVHATCWLRKPDGYFDVPWRRQRGAGPVLVNLIHDVDTLRHLCGEIVAVQAIASNNVRGHEVEDTAAIIVRFASGAVGTLGVSDAIAAPWSWELTANENSAYANTGQNCCMIGGTKGSIAIPGLAVWAHERENSWLQPMGAKTLAHGTADPLALQIRHFSQVALGQAGPLVSGRDGLETLKVIVAIEQAAQSGGTVEVGNVGVA
jgi:predicted dehydrogenase